MKKALIGILFTFIMSLTYGQAITSKQLFNLFRITHNSKLEMFEPYLKSLSSNWSTREDMATSRPGYFSVAYVHDNINLPVGIVVLTELYTATTVMHKVAYTTSTKELYLDLINDLKSVGARTGQGGVDNNGHYRYYFLLDNATYSAWVSADRGGDALYNIEVRDPVPLQIQNR